MNHYPDLTESENAKLNNLIQKIPFKITVEYQKKYDDWKSTWEWPEFLSCSNPRCLTQSQQYESLIIFCEGKGEIVWPLIFSSYLSSEREYLSSLLMEDLILAENESLADEVQQKMQSEHETGQSKFWIYCIRAVLGNL